MHTSDGPAADNVTLFGGGEELTQLNARLAEVEASLEKAQRRIERLLGERNQLSALLDKRDAQIQALNRELGGTHGGRFDRGSGEAASRFWGMLSSLATRIGQQTAGIGGLSSRPAPSDRSPGGGADPAPQVDHRRAPLVVKFKEQSPQAILAVMLFGLKTDEIRNLLPVIARDCETSRMMPLILTDDDGFEVLREQGMIFEYLPSSADRERFSKELNWDLYLQRRLSIIRQKWQPSKIVALGKTAADLLEIWHASPFEPLPLPAATKDQSIAP